MPKLVPVTPNLYPNLSLFLASYFGEVRKIPFWLDRFHLWWESNPAYNKDTDRGWALVNNGDVVGFFGFIPCKFQIVGQEVTIYSTTTWRVLSEYRGGSLALFSKFIRMGKDSMVLSTTPNNSVRQILTASGFELVPRKEDRCTNILVNLRNKVILKLASFGFNEKKLVKSVPEWIDQIPRLLNRKIETSNVRILQHAGKEFDLLWARTKNLYLNTSVRTAEVVNWYCFESQHFTKYLLGYFENNRLLGYMILWETEGKFRTLECLDLWVDPKVAHVEGALISASIQYARQELFDMVSLPYWSISRKDRFKFGIYQVTPMKKKEYFKISQKFADSIDETNSYFAWGQGDIGV